MGQAVLNAANKPQLFTSPGNTARDTRGFPSSGFVTSPNSRNTAGQPMHANNLLTLPDRNLEFYRAPPQYHRTEITGQYDLNV